MKISRSDLQNVIETMQRVGIGSYTPELLARELSQHDLPILDIAWVLTNIFLTRPGEAVFITKSIKEKDNE